MEPQLDCGPFVICPAGRRPPSPRGISSLEGLGDRMRTAAFAELQAVAAFTWATTAFDDAPEGLRAAWRRQIPEEQHHYDLIVARMAALGLGLADRPVSQGLWETLASCTSSREFCLQITAAEERGRVAGLKLAEFLETRDPTTADIFLTIARDEVAHVALANQFFG